MIDLLAAAADKAIGTWLSETVLVCLMTLGLAMAVVEALKRKRSRTEDEELEIELQHGKGG